MLRARWQVKLGRGPWVGREADCSLIYPESLWVGPFADLPHKPLIEPWLCSRDSARWRNGFGTKVSHACICMSHAKFEGIPTDAPLSEPLGLTVQERKSSDLYNSLKVLFLDYCIIYLLYS